MAIPPPSLPPPPLRTDEVTDEWLPAFTPEDEQGTSDPGPVTPPASTPIRNRAQFAWTQQRFILENIKLADAKASFVITLASASLSAFFTRTTVSTSHLVPNVLVAVLTTLGVVSLLSAIALGAWSIKPRIGSRRSPSATSWTEIALYPSLSSYQAASRTLNEEEATEALTEQVFHMSRICHRKHLLIARAIILAMIGGSALITNLVLLHFAGR